MKALLHLFPPIYSLSQEELAALHKFIDENLTTGFIYPSCSPHGDPLLFIWKKDGSLWLCVNFWGLNQISKKDHYPVRVFPLWHPHHPSESTWFELNLLSEVTSSSQSHLPCVYHTTDPIGQSSLDYTMSSYLTGEVHLVLLYNCSLCSGAPWLDLWG